MTSYFSANNPNSANGESGFSLLELADGSTVNYDYLIIATGPELAFDEIEGLGPQGFTQSDNVPILVQVGADGSATATAESKKQNADSSE